MKYPVTGYLDGKQLPELLPERVSTGETPGGRTWHSTWYPWYQVQQVTT